MPLTNLLDSPLVSCIQIDWSTTQFREARQLVFGIKLYGPAAARLRKKFLHQHRGSSLESSNGLKRPAVFTNLDSLLHEEHSNQKPKQLASDAGEPVDDGACA